MAPPNKLREKLELVYAKNDKESALSLDSFLDKVLIDCRPEPQPFGKVAEWWQRERNEKAVPAFEFVAGLRQDYSGPKNFYFGYAKGADKTSYIGRLLNWAAAYAKHPLRMYCCAKDSEQANVIYDCMQREAELNPWYAKHLNFKRNLVEGKENGAKVEILTSDAGGAHGKTPDVIVFDELGHWDSKDLYDALQTAKVKRGGYCISLILTNAGFIGSWQDDIRKVARANNGTTWFFYEQPVGLQLATWIKKEEVDEERKTITEWEARRLFDNEWIDLSESGQRFVSTEDVDRCVGSPQYPPANARVVLGVDYGGTCDPTALAALWWDGQKINVFELKTLQGTKENEIQIDEVRDWIDIKLQQHSRVTIVMDKYQLIERAQHYERAGREVVRFEYRGGKENYRMALTLKNLIQNQKIVFEETAGYCNGITLVKELKKLLIKPMAYGFRVQHSWKDHDDKTVAVGMAAMEALGNPAPYQSFREHTPKHREVDIIGHKPISRGFSGEHFKERHWFGLQ